MRYSLRDIGNASKLYVSTWVRFSPSFTTGGNKIYYVNWTGGSFVMGDNGRGTGPLSLRLNVNHSEFQYGNIPLGATLQRGQWHLIEFALGLSSTSNAPDGTIQAWVDGQLKLNKTGVPIPGEPPFLEVRYSPIYGGFKGAPVQELQYMDLDHVHISGR